MTRTHLSASAAQHASAYAASIGLTSLEAAAYVEATLATALLPEDIPA